MWKSINKIETPKFWEFLRRPNEKTCKIIDETCLKVEILWWVEIAKEEFKIVDCEKEFDLEKLKKINFFKDIELKKIDLNKLKRNDLNQFKKIVIVKDENKTKKLIIDWNYAIIIRYKREKDWKTRPASVLSYNEDDFWNIEIKQLQGSNDKKISFRVNSSFNFVNFYISLIEESFSKKWIYVKLTDFPKWLENIERINNRPDGYYAKLRKWIEILNKKYNITKKVWKK